MFWDMKLEQQNLEKNNYFYREKTINLAAFFPNFAVPTSYPKT